MVSSSRWSSVLIAVLPVQTAFLDRFPDDLGSNTPFNKHRKLFDEPRPVFISGLAASIGCFPLMFFKNAE